ncbi:unnamed protein product [Sphagnum balticum]
MPILLVNVVDASQGKCDVKLGAQQKNITIAIFGFGGRAQWFVRELLKLDTNIRIAALCDDKAKECLEYEAQVVSQGNKVLFDAYQNAVSGVKTYPDSPEGINALLAEHPEVDVVFITSTNNRHADHLRAALKKTSCKNIFMEKPLFRTVQEFTDFNGTDLQGKNITIGLTLRYSSMAHIVASQLQKHQTKLGRLESVKAWEHLMFSHALTAFIMGSRRLSSIWGGFLLEKSIHDLDLALFFMKSLGIDPVSIKLNSKSAHTFYTKSHQKEILDHVLQDTSIANWKAHSHPWWLVDFVKGDNGKVDWPKTLEKIFEGYPKNDDFEGSDIIPDYHALRAEIQMPDGKPVVFEFEVDMGRLSPTMERSLSFVFENGKVLVDIMASRMSIEMKDGTVESYDLKTNNNDHADGDLYIMHTILGKRLPEGYFMATITDPTVLLANIMALASEEQVLNKKKDIYLKKINGAWHVSS